MNPSNNNSFTRLVSINSLMLALLLTANFVSIFLASLGNFINDGLIPIIFFSALGVSYLMALFTKQSIKLNKRTILFLFYITSIFMFTFVFRGLNTSARDYFIQFLAYGIITYLLSILPYRVSIIIRSVMLIGIIVITNPIGFLEFISISESAFGRVNMGASYAILPSVMASIIHFFFYRNLKNWLNALGYLANVYLLFLLITQGSRGAVLSVLLLIFLVVFIKISKKINKNKSLLYPLIFSIGFMVLIFILFNLDWILLQVYSLLQGAGYEIAAIIKTYNLLVNEGILGILNGRDVIYINSLELFNKSPIWGHGVGVYADIYGSWPHNIFLQTMIEGGLLFAVPIGVLVALSFWSLIKPWPSGTLLEENRLLLLLLFMICIPRLLFSSYLWEQQSFWLMIFVLLRINIKQKINIKNS